MESDLPFEVLCLILSHVPPHNRLSAGLVCRRWQQATNTLLEGVQFTVRGSTGGKYNLMDSLKSRTPTSQEASTLLLRSSRPFSRLAFIKMDIDDAIVDFLNGLGRRLLHLRFVNCTVPTKKLINCPRLRTLQTDRGSMLLNFVSLPCLVDLDIGGADTKMESGLNDEVLMAFDKISAPHLKVFSMPRPTEHYETHRRVLCKRFYPKGTNFESHPSPYILSYAALEAFVAKRATTLTTLHLPRNITRSEALRISNLPGLQLKAISFDHCSYMAEFCRNQPGLVELHAVYPYSLTDQQVLETCKELPALRKFSVYYQDDFFSYNETVAPLDQGVVDLLRLPSLSELHLHNCRKVVPDSFSVAILLTPTLEHLRALSLSYSQIQDYHILALLPKIPLLEELDLTACNISEETLSSVCLQLKQLRSLVLKHCCKSVSNELLRVIRNLTLMERLELSDCRRLTSTGVKESIRFPLLRELGVQRCTRVFKNILKPLKANNPYLTKIWW